MLLKSISNEIVKPLTLIINQPLESRIFPNAFQTSKVIPIYKKGDKANLSNLSNLCCQLYQKYLNESYIYDCKRISAKIIDYVNSSTGFALNILPN